MVDCTAYQMQLCTYRISKDCVEILMKHMCSGLTINNRVHQGLFMTLVINRATNQLFCSSAALLFSTLYFLLIVCKFLPIT